MPVLAQQASPKQAIVVIRHGEDLQNWIVAEPNGKAQVAKTEWRKVVPTWPTYDLPAGTTVLANAPNQSDETKTSLKLYQHGLSSTGEAQAIFFRDHLPWLLSQLQIKPIDLVVTKYPRPDAATTNPFDTIYPLIGDKENFKGKVLLVQRDPAPVDSGLMKMLPDITKSDSYGSLLAGHAGSTLLCWDAEGLWGAEKTASGDRIWNPNSILGKLGNPFMDKHFQTRTQAEGGGVPAKGARVYIFTPRLEPKFKSGYDDVFVPGYDCMVLDVVREDPDDNTNTKKVFEDRAILSVDNTGTLIKKYPNAVYDHYNAQESQSKYLGD